MNIVKDIIEENAMSGKLKITEKTGGGDTTDTDSQQKSKSKKRSEPSLDQVDPKNVKITLPLSKIDESSTSSMSKHSHETDSIPRRKKSSTIPGPSVKVLKELKVNMTRTKIIKLAVVLKNQNRNLYVYLHVHY